MSVKMCLTDQRDGHAQVLLPPYRIDHSTTSSHHYKRALAARLPCAVRAERQCESLFRDPGVSSQGVLKVFDGKKQAMSL